MVSVVVLPWEQRVVEPEQVGEMPPVPDLEVGTPPQPRQQLRGRLFLP